MKVGVCCSVSSSLYCRFCSRGGSKTGGLGLLRYASHLHGTNRLYLAVEAVEVAHAKGVYPSLCGCQALGLRYTLVYCWVCLFLVFVSIYVKAHFSRVLD